MPKFVVTKCVDAFIHYEAIVDAENAAEARRLGEECHDDHFWIEAGESQYDHVDFDNIPPRLYESEEITSEPLAGPPKPTMSGDELMEMLRGNPNDIVLVVSQVERDTILAALRYWQQAVERGELQPMLLDIATNGESHELMSAEAIDQLCEEINI